ncbi:LacI family DNA-binding transcriptional regulator [Xylanivirga thermophila]|uniref:LacI family DNA-binding transcriptional regulator n=1 Tax=Xylanivirga thermophila TaxID=2496273 RepID=UPI00101D0C0C|nr:LacI family DNA-binding transcriptional regulator [Xylanivirga thermophila]
MSQRVTMKDIADRLGVSNVTVSKALNDKEGVSEELRTKIKKTANEMGYRYNTAAKSIRKGYNYNIGVVVAEKFTNDVQSFYFKFYHHISKILENYQYFGMLHILTYAEERELMLPKMYNEMKVDGLIILGQISKAYIEILKEVDVPVVFLDFYDEHGEFDCVISDNFYSAYEITNYLINKGHTKIAFVGNIYATSSIQDRFLGYYKSLLEHGMQLDKEYIISDRDNDGKLIDLSIPKNLPTAFVCNCDRIAYNLAKKLNEQGYRIPEDCSIVGFDNDIFSTLSDLKLTTVEVNMKEMAETAIKIIMSKVQDSNKKYGRVSIKGKIIYRDSVEQIK